MNRVWRHILAASFTACVGGLALPACAHDDSSMYIVHVVAPPKPGQAGEGCVYPAPSITQTYELSGLFDVGLAGSYSPVVLIGNHLVARGDPTIPRTETNRLSLRGTVVRLTDSQGNEVRSFTSLTEGTIDPQIGTTPGLLDASLTLVDSDTADRFRRELTNRAARRTLVAFFKVFGQSLGGTYVESGEFQHIVEVCNGCSVSFPPDAEDPDPQLVHPNCKAGIAAGGSSTIVSACVPGQDQAIDCRLCQGRAACDPLALRP